MREKKDKNKVIKKSMTFAEIMQKHPESAEALMSEGMPCFGCPMAMQETLEQGAIAHGLNPNKIVEKLNKKKSSRKRLSSKNKR